MLSGICKYIIESIKRKLKGEALMVINYNRKTFPYRIFLAIVLIVEMHFFSLFTLPKGLEFIIYTNKSKWIGALSVVVGLVCYEKHKIILSRYIKFLKKYFIAVIVSIIFISFYTTIKYPLNPLITTYGFASYYLYSFLAIPILYIFSVEDGYENLFGLFNSIAVIMYIITIIQGIAYIKTGSLFFSASADLNTGNMIRDGKVRFNSGALAFLMIIYNFYILYNYRNKKNSKKLIPIISIILGLLSIYFTGNSRIMVLTLLASLGILILLGDGSSKKKLIALIVIFAGIFILFGSGMIAKFLDSFSSTGELGGSSIARWGAYKYYWECFMKNPIFANGFVGDENYYDIVHGASGISYQTVYVRFFYDDVGIVGQLALLGVSVISIYIWPVFRIIKIAFKTCKNSNFSDGKFIMALACYILCTTPTLIVIDSSRVIAFPIILAVTEYIFVKYLDTK